MHPRREGMQAACLGDRYDAQHGQADGAHRHAEYCRHKGRTCLCTKKWWKNQVPSAKKHRK